MFNKCPGQDTRKLRVEVYKCPQCGAEVELFSDETRIKCQQCGAMVFREQLPSCISWCASARQCLGEERWQQIMGGKDKAQNQVKPEGDANDHQNCQESNPDR